MAKGAPSVVRLERLAEHHIPLILAIEHLVNTAPWSEKSFRNEINNAQSVFRIALLNGKLVGYGGLWLVIDEAHITTVAVSPEHRRMGIARKIIVELLQEAQTYAMHSATLEVREGNEAAIALYEGLGFRKVAVRKSYYPDNRENAIVMWLDDLVAWEPNRSS